MPSPARPGFPLLCTLLACLTALPCSPRLLAEAAPVAGAQPAATAPELSSKGQPDDASTQPPVASPATPDATTPTPPSAPHALPRSTSGATPSAEAEEDVPTAPGTDTPHPVRSDRLVRDTGQFRIEYSPGQELYLNAVAQTLEQRRLARLATPPRSSAPSKIHPLSATACRLGHEAVLARISAYLALGKPTELQEACYDTFLGYYALRESALSVPPALMAQLSNSTDFALWGRVALAKRLKAGEKIEGFSYDQATDSINWSLSLNAKNEEEGSRAADTDKDLKKKRLDHAFNYETKDGITQIRASFTRKREKGTQAAGINAAKLAETETTLRSQAANLKTCLPVTLNGKDKVPYTPQQAAHALIRQMDEWDRLGAGLNHLQADPTHLYILLHETTEAGVVDRYLGSADRRWFCDGVANYVAWAIAREKGGEDFARKVYDLDTALAKAAVHQSKINLAKWTAVENQKDDDKDSALSSAHYAFATRAVFLMHEQAGPDILPRLFTELAKTPRRKASMKTVAALYKKLTGHSLEEVLTLAESKPLPALPPSPAAK